MTNEEAIRILCGKAPLVICDRTGNTYDKTEELKTTIIAAFNTIGSIQDFGDMINDHADETWTGEEIVQTLMHRGLYQVESEKPKKIEYPRERCEDQIAHRKIMELIDAVNELRGAE